MWLATLARVGLVAKGISFAIVGVLALELVLAYALFCFADARYRRV